MKFLNSLTLDLRTVRLAALLGLVCRLLTASAWADDETPQLPVSVSVKTAGPAAPSAAMPLQPVPRAVTTRPDARMPQYQMRHDQRRTTVSYPDGKLRFLLAMPSGPILVEAAITIDGVPFSQVREQRIQELLKELAKPAEIVLAESLPQRPPAVPSQEQLPQDDEAEPAQPVIPPTRSAYVQASTVIERIRRYAATMQSPPDPDELRWLLTEWIDGPVVLQLQDHFQRFRAGQRPAFQVLDRNRDGKLTADELALIEQSLAECDLNRDDIVAFLEIEESARDPRNLLKSSGGHGFLLTLLNEQSAAEVTRRVRAHYANAEATVLVSLGRHDANQDGLFSVEELQQLRAVPADLGLELAFDTHRPANSRLSVTSARAPVALISSLEESQTIRLSVAGAELHLTARQGSGDQVSLGAVEDGYPLLTNLDPSGDDGLTIRERRRIAERVLRYDANNDGEITAGEAVAPIRLCLGLGAVVHDELAVLRPGDKVSIPESVSAPAWFVRMDRNQDSDLSRKEFPGTDDQFAELDADHDELVSAAEAVAFDEAQRKPNNTENRLPPAEAGTDAAKVEP